jgi:CBS domain-containing protein
MDVRSILATKGNEVAVIGTEARVSSALEQLVMHNIGALVVSNDGDHIEGLLAERDLVLGLREHGSRLLDERVAAVMTCEVATCQPADSVPELMSLMTELRTRHLPVVVDGCLVGIVSIGDVVKRRVDELELLNEEMVQYIRGR